MHERPRRAWLLAAAELYAEVVASTLPADRCIAAYFRARPGLGRRDRAFIAETAYAMMRQRRRLDRAAAWLPREHDNAMGRVYLHLLDAAAPGAPPPPGDARVVASATAALQRSAVEPLPDDPVAALALRHSLPDWVVAHWVGRLGMSEASDLCAAMNQPAPLCIRVNTLRATREEVRARLAGEGLAATPTRGSPVGLVLEKRTNLFVSPSFRAGLFEVQDEASQLVGCLTGARPGQCVIDGCAGGGGKTLHLASLMANKGRLYAFDAIARRLDALRKRARRAGAHNIRAHVVDGARPRLVRRLHGSADVVLVDAPCSGLGVLRRNPDAAWKVTPAAVAELPGRQRALLDAYAPAVRRGGRLVYATCTLLAAENEDVVEGFLAAHPEFRIEPALEVLGRQGLQVSQHDTFLRLSPHRHGTDGFFAAVMARAAS